MSITKDEFYDLERTSLDEVNGIVGDCFSYKGQQYTGVINEVEFTSELMEGGALFGLATTIVVPKTQLSTKPSVGETVLIHISLFRIENVKEDQTSFTLTLVTAAV